MKIAIGIFSWNEEKNIAHTIQSISKQSVFVRRSERLADFEWDIVVIANGCTDDTVTVAKKALSQHLGHLSSVGVAINVYEIEEAGKSNAWNEFVHEYCDSSVDIFVMLDSDIEFGNKDTIFNSIQLLVQSPGCSVVVDKPLKHFSKNDKQSPLEKISLHFSNETLERSPAIAGSFYCAKGDILRNIWMPKGLPAEDGFLKAMVITDCFKSEVNPLRLLRAANADHYYEGITNLKAVFRHEVRLVVGTTINCYLTWDFLKFATDPLGQGAGMLIRNWISTDPTWFKSFVKNEIRNRGFWVLPRGMLFRRLSPIVRAPFMSAARKLPIAFMAFIFDVFVLTSANRKLKSGKAIGFW